MSDNRQMLNGAYEDKMRMFRNVNHSATNYVQNAIENMVESTQDATQNLVNATMKKRVK
ncbi:hypothetical protein [Niallia endozanthoxylica]|uniref:hypothetical protein n=1 Tax=Niallia endozanthoxylica TaxID=2036016 RepID=UPI00168BE514|nr:hypothetical protein [Niallia endozanthoxylica]